jgi:hypothetical protein
MSHTTRAVSTTLVVEITWTTMAEYLKNDRIISHRVFFAWKPSTWWERFLHNNSKIWNLSSPDWIGTYNERPIQLVLNSGESKFHSHHSHIRLWDRLGYSLFAREHFGNSHVLHHGWAASFRDGGGSFCRFSIFLIAPWVLRVSWSNNKRVLSRDFDSLFLFPETISYCFYVKTVKNAFECESDCNNSKRRVLSRDFDSLFLFPETYS